MSESKHPGAALAQSNRRRVTAAERFANLGDRLAGKLPAPARTQAPVEAMAEPEYPIEDEQLTSWYEVVPRFPLARSGYDCAAVDEHVASLEQELAELDDELAELRARVPAQDEVSAEIQKVGEQTSSILLAAHDRARETTQEAQAQAERCLADAAAQALAITDEANRKKAEIEQETRRIAEERGRLLVDMETLAGTVARVVREHAQQITPPVPVGPSIPPPASAAGQQQM